MDSMTIEPNAINHSPLFYKILAERECTPYAWPSNVLFVFFSNYTELSIVIRIERFRYSALSQRNFLCVSRSFLRVFLGACITVR